MKLILTPQGTSHLHVQAIGAQSVGPLHYAYYIGGGGPLVEGVEIDKFQFDAGRIGLAPGTYTLSLDVSDHEGTIVASATAAFIFNSGSTEIPSPLPPAPSVGHCQHDSFTLFVGESLGLLPDGINGVRFEVCAADDFEGPVWRVTKANGDNYADFGGWFAPETTYKTRAICLVGGEEFVGPIGEATTTAAPPPEEPEE